MLLLNDLNAQERHQLGTASENTEIERFPSDINYLLIENSSWMEHNRMEVICMVQY